MSIIFRPKLDHINEVIFFDLLKCIAQKKDEMIIKDILNIFDKQILETHIDYEEIKNMTLLTHCCMTGSFSTLKIVYEKLKHHKINTTNNEYKSCINIIEKRLSFSKNGKDSYVKGYKDSEEEIKNMHMFMLEKFLLECFQK